MDKLIKVEYIGYWTLENGVKLYIDDIVEITYKNRKTKRENKVVTKIYDLTEDEIRIKKEDSLFYIKIDEIIKIEKQNSKTNKNKIDIRKVSLCPRCCDYSKFNAILVNEKENRINIEYICDCGQIHLEDVHMEYVL